MDKMIIANRVLAYNDTQISNNPLRKQVDWARNYMNLEVLAPKSNSFVIAAGATLNVFSGLVSTSIDAATEFTLSINLAVSGHYRFNWTATGADPVFRTKRTFNPNTKTYTWVVNSNTTVTLTSSLAGDFVNAVVGDWIYVPDATLGDTGTSPFDPLNSGYWYIIAKDVTNTILQISRFPGSTFVAWAGAFLSTSANDMVIYSAAGVQINNKVNVSAGFSAPVLQTYNIVGVTPTWIDVTATGALPVAQTAVPGISGMLFYSAAKNFCLAEYDQECVIQVNGDTTELNRLAPWSAGDSENTGQFMRTGPMWSMSIINKSVVDLNATVITSE